MDELKTKIAKLPAWVRQHIERLEDQAEPNNAELRRLRQKVKQAEDVIKQLGERMEAMTEIFRCAARGGNETAQAYVDRIINEHTLVGDD